MKDSDVTDHNIEQSQESAEAPVVVTRDELSRVHETASQLIETLRDIPEGDLVGEIIANALKLLRDRTNRGDSDTVLAPNTAAASACGRGRMLAPAPATTRGTIASR